MAAVLSPRPVLTPSEHAGTDPASGAAPWNGPLDRSARSHLRLVEGGRSDAGARPAAGARGPVLVLVAGVALAAVVALASLGALQLLGADAAASGPASTTETLHPAGAGASTPPASAEVVVQPGDTLWAIARRLQPSGDIRELVDELARRAGGVALVSGQRLDVSGLAG